MTGIIPIPSGLLFETSGKMYMSGSDQNASEFNESANFLPYLIEAQQSGSAGNLDTLNNNFSISQTVNFTAENQSVISGGQDAIKQHQGIGQVQAFNASDDRLNKCLIVGKAIVKARVGSDSDTIFDNELIQEAVLIASAWRLQNSSFDEVTLNVEILDVRRFYRDRTYQAMLLEIEHLITASGLRNLDPYFE